MMGIGYRYFGLPSFSPLVKVFVVEVLDVVVATFSAKWISSNRIFIVSIDRFSKEQNTTSIAGMVK